jgi:histidine triad (HIT) family protein
METASSHCIFCDIISSKVDCRKLYDDDDIIAFTDIHPMAPLHFLIVPKRHIQMLSDTKTDDIALLGKMMYMAPVLVKEQGFCPGMEGGFRVMMNTGPDGGQEVPHIHLHVLAGPKPWGPSSNKKRSVTSKEGSGDSPAEVSKGSVFMPVSNGKLAASGTPGKGGVGRWANAGASVVVTLLDFNEADSGVTDIKQECLDRGLRWIHLPLKGRNSLTAPQQSDYQSLARIPEICQLLDQGSNVVVHCAAGLHRTGSVCYLVMRLCGLTTDTALTTLGAMRAKTCEEMKVAIKRQENMTLQEIVESRILPFIASGSSSMSPSDSTEEEQRSPSSALPQQEESSESG